MRRAMSSFNEKVRGDTYDDYYPDHRDRRDDRRERGYGRLHDDQTDEYVRDDRDYDGYGAGLAAASDRGGMSDAERRMLADAELERMARDHTGYDYDYDYGRRHVDPGRSGRDDAYDDDGFATREWDGYEPEAQRFETDTRGLSTRELREKAERELQLMRYRSNADKLMRHQSTRVDVLEREAKSEQQLVVQSTFRSLLEPGERAIQLHSLTHALAAAERLAHSDRVDRLHLSRILVRVATNEITGKATPIDQHDFEYAVTEYTAGSRREGVHMSVDAVLDVIVDAMRGARSEGAGSRAGAQQRAMQRAFDLMDQDRDGGLTRRELTKMLRDTGVDDPRIVEGVFSICDTDGDGIINAEEYKGALRRFSSVDESVLVGSLDEQLIMLIGKAEERVARAGSRMTMSDRTITTHAARERRGTCPGCGRGVYTDETRMTDLHGVYWHEACHQ